MQLPADDEPTTSSGLDSQTQYILAVGGPGGPKDLVLQKVAQTLKCEIISSADVLRSSRQNGSDVLFS